MKTFVKAALVATLATYFLIFIGGLVRVSGAGLGCPDWPTCYGSWIPPMNQLHLQQLITRAEEGSRAYAVLKDIDVATFNFTLVWIEYVNRMAGVVVGLTIIALLLVAVWKVREYKRLTIGALAILLLTLFQGWLGGVVVQTKLHHVVVSLHMGLALVMISALLYLLIWPTYKDAPVSQRHRRLRVGFILIWFGGIAQIAGGAWLRGSLEELTLAMPLATDLMRLDLAGEHKYFHIVLGVVLGVTSIVLALRVLRQETDSLCRSTARAVVVLAALQLLVGFVFRPLGLWPILQVVHLWLASLWLGGIMILVVGLRYATTEEPLAHRTTGAWLAAGIAFLVATSAGGMVVLALAERSRTVATTGLQVSDFRLPASDGGTFSHEDLLGRISIVTFMFTRCPTICPTMNAEMARLYRLFDDPERVQFVSISSDPQYDTPEILRDYAESFGVDDQRWRFLTGDEDEAKRMAREIFLVPDNFPNHSTKLILVDPEGQIRGYYAYDSAARLDSLRNDIQRLAREYWPQ